MIRYTIFDTITKYTVDPLIFSDEHSLDDALSLLKYCEVADSYEGEFIPDRYRLEVHCEN